MELFQAIPTNGGDATIRAALAATINRARENNLTTAGWSLAELHLDDGDVEWLQRWARTLDGETARRWLMPDLGDAIQGALPVRRAAIGVLLLLLTSEQARRRPLLMPRDNNWLVAPSTFFNEPIRQLLFNDDQPTELYINSLMQASERLHLRQNGGWTSPDSEQENIALQIALTRCDLPERWPRWLRGEPPPEHIARLLDAETGSHSFQQLWQDCCDFLEGDLSEAELRATVSHSPWILPQWVDSLLASLNPHREQIARLIGAPQGSPIAQVEILPAPLPAEAIPEAEPSRPNQSIEHGYGSRSGSDRVDSSGASHASTRSLPLPVPYQHEAARVELGDIFGALTPYGGVKTIIRAARAILRRADKLKLRGRAWSLAELRAGDGDYVWLRVWVKRLEVLTVWFGTETRHRFNIGCEQDEEFISYRAALGCLLLLWLAETARRQCQEGELWSGINPEDFDQTVAVELFRAGRGQKNQPSSFLRESLAGAVRELNLRHALDDGGRCWTETVFLQFGFTRSDFNRHLPEWLAGQADTRSLRELLDEEKGSASFQSLWRALRSFQQGEIAEDRLRELVAGNEWILPEWPEWPEWPKWVDDLLIAARRKPADDGRAAGLADQQRAEAARPEQWPVQPGEKAGEMAGEMAGAARLTAAGWQPLTGNEVLTVAEARASRFRINTPAKRDDRGEWVRWAVMEGDEMARRWEGGDGPPIPMDSLTGLGAPLTLRSGPFDNPNDEFQIAASVIDRGLIEDVVCESLPPLQAGAARVLRLKVAGRAEPGDKHFVVWWNENGEAGRLAPDYCDDAEDGWWWVCKVPEGVSRFIAVGIARDGAREGAWWPDDWAELLAPVIDREPLIGAALLRWLRLPVLGAEVSAVFHNNSRRHAPEFLSAWLKDYGLPEWLRADASWRPQALSALRSLFHQWWPEAEMASRVLMTLANALTVDELNENLSEVARMLCEVDPLLLAAILKVGKEQVLIGSPSELRMRLAGSQTKPEYEARKQQLMADCCEALGVNRSAIQAGLLDCAARWLGGYELHRHEERNLALARQIESARLLLALHLLERI